MNKMMVSVSCRADRAARVAPVVAAVVALAGCGSNGAEREAFQGVVELDERVIAFEVAGRVRSVDVKRGDALDPGARIATVDDALARPLRDARAAEVAAAKAQVDLLRAGTRAEDVKVVAAQLDGAKATVAQLEKSLERQKQLAARGAAGVARTDDLEGELARARAEVSALGQRLRALRDGARPEELAVAEARLAAATAALAAEEERLARHVLAVERSGTVLDVHVDPGETAAAGAPVVTLADTAHPYVDVFVPQARLAEATLGARATVRVDAHERPFDGTVEDVARRTEFTPRYLFSERERPNLVVRVRIRIDDPERRLHAGVPAFVTLAGARP